VREGLLCRSNARHRVVGAFSYEPKNKAWHADINLHWMGPQRLPDTKSLPEALRQPEFSRAFSVTNVQFTKVWKKLEVYAGCENLFDFRQIRPIINWQNPFGESFGIRRLPGGLRGDGSCMVKDEMVGLTFSHHWNGQYNITRNHQGAQSTQCASVAPAPYCHQISPASELANMVQML